MAVIYFVAILLVTTLALAGDPGCPTSCTCNQIGSSGISAKCSAFDSTQRFGLTVSALDLSDIPESSELQLTARIFSKANLKYVSSIKIVNSHLKTIDVNAFRGLRELYALNLTANHLSLLEPDMFSGNQHLARLSLSQNPLEYMQADPSPYESYFLNIPSLEEIDLSQCNISHLLPTMFTELPALIYINLAYNNISEISSDTFKPLMDLEEVDLSHNQLTYLNPDTFQNNTELDILHLQNNKLSSLSDISMPYLLNLDISQCQFSIIDNSTFAGFGHLKNLNLSGNSLTTLPSDTFANLKKLLYLDLSNNNLVGEIPDDLFINNNQLETLRLQNNPQMKTLPESGFKGEFSELYLLDVSNCGLTHLEEYTLRSMQHLAFLNLANNEIQYIRPGVLNSKIEFLNLSGNKIVHLDQVTFAPNSALKKLHLSGNPLKKVSPKNFVNTPRLSQLFLKSCDLKQLWDFTGNKTEALKNLIYLNVADNQIKDITIKDLSYIQRVQTLILTNNPLSCTDDVNKTIHHLIEGGVASSVATARKHLEEIRYSTEDVEVDDTKDQLGWDTLLSQICAKGQEYKISPTYDTYYDIVTDDIVETTETSDVWETETWDLPNVPYNFEDEIQKQPVEQTKSNYMWPVIIVSLSAFAIILALLILAAFFLRWNRQKNSYRNKILKRHSLCNTPRLKRGWNSVYQQLYEDPTTTPTTPVMPTKNSSEHSTEQKTYMFPEKNSQEVTNTSAPQTNINTSYLSSTFHHSNIVPESV